MNSHPTKNDLPDLDGDGDLENDALWSLLNEATPAEASPRFAQDTLRRLRLEEAQAQPSWWKSLLSPKPLLGAASIALAALAIFLSLPSDPVAQQEADIAQAPLPAEDWNELEHAVASELLSFAAEDPTLLSDEEIVALLF